MQDKAGMLNWGRKKRLFVYDWPAHAAPETFSAVAEQPYSLYLDSNRPAHPLSRYSYICWHPFEIIESKDGHVRVSNRDNSFTYAADPFHVVRERLSLWGEDVKARKDLPPFQGGAAGYFGYDLARGLETLPSRAQPHRQPDMCIGLYDKIIAYDHAQNRAYLIIHAEDEAGAMVHKSYIENAVRTPKQTSPAEDPLDWHTGTSEKDLETAIARTIEYIHAGDIFQANISRRFSARLPRYFSPYAHYLNLRQINPAPYGAYMNFGRTVLSGSSPERFLLVKDRKVETRPIKGTLSSSLPASILSDSEKDRAENIMIVDLLRNDLSIVCEDHSVIIEDLCGIETFEGLHHMVSTVSGRLRGDMSCIDALKACFPGGSITGAPKIRAMEIIDELEPHRRGAYCGAMGYAGFDGTMDTAIIIRTLVYENDYVHLQTGGGIVADSVPASEVTETLVKAEKIFESFEGKKMRKSA